MEVENTDSLVENTIIDALSDMNCIESFEYIINSERIDVEVKEKYIKDHYSLLEEFEKTQLLIYQKDVKFNNTYPWE